MQNPTAQKWYYKPGKDGDAAISTRIRLARNIAGYPFPQRMSIEQKKELNKIVCDALKNSNSSIGREFEAIDMQDVTDTKALAMAERHLISPDFVRNREGKYLLILPDESVSIMLCEEDHLRIQVMKSGISVEECLDLAQKIDAVINESLSYAFDDTLGYLTACPTNLGTGMRASVMLHIPALETMGRVGQITSAVSKIGLTLRGAFGEGSRADGGIYQLSNQITLGISEESAVQNLVSIARQVIEKEREARKEFNKIDVEDKSLRAVAILKSARVLSSAELTELVGLIRMGISEGYVNDITNEKLTEIIFDTKRANITLIDKTAKTPRERDIARAKAVRERI